MSQVSLDISGIARGQPRIPEPIADALSALQTGHNDTDTKLSNTTSGHDHDGTDSKKVSTSSLSDFTDWTDWSPTWDTNGAGTLSATAVSFAKYMRIGNVVFFKVDATHTISSSDAATTAIRFTLPVNTTAAAHIFFALVKDPADDLVLNPGYGLHIHATAANKVYVYRVHAGNAVNLQKQWSNGTLREVWVMGFYRVA